MSVVSFPAPANTAVGELLATTLVFERVVDAVLAFQQARGALAAGEVPSLERARVRDGLSRLLNELDPAVRGAAEARCAAYVTRALRMTTSVAAAAHIPGALDDYRQGLLQVPLRGVGILV